ncbi:ankyrin repeat protein [Anaeramoeba ignava]|uniref:Ankyrin repeat protein n=1 Tax=Anaeramoeba ignava TaxID=1746090 RepID=A0A9Q0L631_ANAIG|nr:ankyrin repeat protein [Anaeramoeba ignava]
MGQTNSKEKLLIACEKNSIKDIEKLIEKGIDLNLKDENEETILHFICNDQNQFSFEIIKFLIEKGADVNAKNKYQEAPLHYICRADVNARNENQETPLHYICQTMKERSIETMNFLISKGAYANAKNKFQETPLHFACKNTNEKSIDTINILVSNGADVNFKNNKQETPLYLICQKYHKNINSNKIIHFLIEKKGDPNLTNNYQETSLHILCKSKDINENLFETIKFLVLNGADVNIKNKKQETPLNLIYQNQNEKMKEKAVQFLLMNNANPFDIPSDDFSQKIIDFLLHVYSINDDLNNLLKSNDNFSDLTIQSIDSSQFKVHKLILLTRFDNDEAILQEFINICKTKSKRDIEIALNFIYTGFPDFDKFIQQIKDPKKSKPDEDYDFFFQSDNLDYLYQIQNENQRQTKKATLIKIFQEIWIDLNWIESKKGRKGILEDLHKLYQGNKTKDFTIIISEEKEIKVHKLILILRSELYKGMFLNIQDSSNQVHDYSKKSNETIQQLIHFFYHDKFDKEKEIKKKNFMI